MIDLEPYERGTGYWKLNCLLLEQNEYLQAMKLELEQTLQSSKQKNPIDLWETLKSRIKKFTIQFSKNRVSEDKEIIANLSEKVCEYESRLPLRQEEDKLYEKKKIELEEKLKERVRGLIFRSKVRWYEGGEQNSKYFFALEKARYNSRTCYKVMTEEGQEYSHPSVILEKQKDFYSELYKKDQNIIFDMENTFGITVPENIRKQQDEQISIKELQQAIKTMNNNKTPGKDGIPVDFYKVFWEQLKKPFYDMVQKCYEQKYLHDTARQGILNLIPKHGKDTRMIKNLRPITLLNTDYKIIEKAIANKMLPALERIIHRDQRGFMKDRRISVNIRKLLDIMYQTELQDIEAVVLSLDFVKCFDRCSFSILHGSLEFFEFGNIIKEWTKILYKDFTVEIQNNGYFSQKIDIQKGVHQGGCCSSVYFLVIAEILALALRHNEQIEGITIRHIRNLLNQFADDMDVFSLNDEKSLKAIHQELQKFYNQSGFLVSYDKTTMYRIGSLKYSDATLYDMEQYKWSNGDINVLGVTISHDDIVQKNYAQLKAKVDSTLAAWYNRGLSLIGRVLVVNTLIASLFIYKMMVLPKIPANIVKAINNSIRNFIWNGKKAKIAYTILQNPKKEGGLNLVNLQNRDKALKATWPQILSKEEEYSQLVYTIMRCQFLGDDIWRCNIKKEDVKILKIRNSFWNDVLESWSEYNYYHNRTIENQLIWYNSQIKVKKKFIFWRDCYNRGLKYVYQLFQNGEYKDDDKVWQEYGLTTLRYNSIKLALPKEWKDFYVKNSQSAFQPLPPHTYDMALLACGKGFSKKVYEFLQDDVMIIHNKYLKWRQEIGEDFVQGLCEYGTLHANIYTMTNIPKYRSFQYRLLQRGIVTNIQLYKWKIVESENCTFCREHKETYRHLFVECEKVQEVWLYYEKFIRDNFHIQIGTISAQKVLMNLFHKEKRNISNFIGLVVKQFIYAERCGGLLPNIQKLSAILSRIENIEKYIAIKNGKLTKHYKKWDRKCDINSSDENVSLNIMIQQYLDQME